MPGAHRSFVIPKSDSGPDPVLAANAVLWEEGAIEAQLIDVNWLAVTGALDVATWECVYGYPCLVQVSAYATDGLIDHRSAGFGAGYARLIAGDISHTEQTTSATVASTLRNLLHDEWGIANRTGGPPPPPQWPVQILGAGNAVRPGDTCYWYASSGIGGAHYEWKVDGTVVGSSQELWLTASSSFTLSVLVWNDQGDVGQTQLFVQVSEDNQLCQVQ